MNKLRRKGFTVEADLKEFGYENYFVECTYKYIKKKEKYLLRMGLAPKNFDTRLKIEFNEIDVQLISSTRETIEEHISRIIEYMAADGSFDGYIKQFEYECKCFDLGNEILEQKTNDKIWLQILQKRKRKTFRLL